MEEGENTYKISGGGGGGGRSSLESVDYNDYSSLNNIAEDYEKVASSLQMQELETYSPDRSKISNPNYLNGNRVVSDETSKKSIPGPMAINDDESANVPTDNNNDSDNGDGSGNNGSYTWEDVHDIEEGNNDDPSTARSYVNERRMSSKGHDLSKIKKGSLYDEDELEEDGMDYEGLQEQNYENTDWVPPSLEKAEEYRVKHSFHGGTSKMKDIKMTKVLDFGTGVPLYFQFIKSFAILFFFMSLLSVPSILFCFYGEHILPTDRDGLQLYRFTLGNLGYNPESATYSEDAACMHTANTTCVHLPGDMELTLSQASSILTACEFLQIFCFFTVVWALSHRTRIMKKEASRATCAVSDYTLMVRNVPTDVTEKELIDHFSGLYPLDVPDWRRRPPLDGAAPVDNVHNSGHASLYRGTWVAECTIHRKIGSYINAFMSKRKVTEELYRQRAKYKMYKEGTSHKGGADSKRMEDADKKLNELTAVLEMQADGLKSRIQHKLISVNKAKTQTKTMNIVNPNKVTPMKDNEGNVDENLAFIDDNINTTPRQNDDDDHDKVVLEDIEASAAFIVFQYSESMARAVEDYKAYRFYLSWSWLPTFLRYPDRLLIKGERVSVKQAPEPDEMIWENIEVSTITKMFNRLRTNALTFLLLIIGFAIVLQASIYKQVFEDEKPDLSVCDAELPALYAGSYTSTSLSNMEFTRSGMSTPVSSLDQACDSQVASTFYGIYGQYGNGADNSTWYDMNVCVEDMNNANTTGLCPHAGQSIFCPCISLKDMNQTCQTLMCDSDTTHAKCKEFSSNTIADCFCMDSLSSIITDASSLNDLVSKLQSALTTDPCKTFYETFLTAVSLGYAAIVVSVVVNTLVKLQISMSAKWESHDSCDKQNASLVTKLFLSTYFNMIIVVLIAFARYDAMPEFLKSIKLLQGQFQDFDAGWYPVVGTYFIMTYIIEMITPIGTSLLSYYIVQPFQRYFATSGIKEKSSHKIVRQKDLNDLQNGPEFDPTFNTAELLLLTFFSMTFASGIPIMMPLAFITFAAYFFIEKMLFLHYYKTPSHLDDGVTRVVLGAMPWAATLRCAFSCWIYGNKTIFYASYTSDSGVGDADAALDSYSNFLENNSDYSYASFVDNRLLQENVFPLTVLFIIIIALKLVAFAYSITPVHIILTMSHSFAKLLSNTSKVVAVNESGKIAGWDLLQMRHPLREESAPFTGIYFHYLRNTHEKPKSYLQQWVDRFHRWVGDEQHDPTSCTKEELRTGWREADMKNAASWIRNFIVKIKIWEKDSDVTYFGKSIHKKQGEWKRTFEIIQDHGGIYSYNIDHIPAYETIMMGVHEGTRHAKMESPRVSPRVDEDSDACGDIGLQGGQVTEKIPNIDDDNNDNDGNNDNDNNNDHVDNDNDNDKSNDGTVEKAKEPMIDGKTSADIDDNER